MATSSLENLPVETLRHICEYINETHIPSLRALALVSKRCHSAAIIVLSHTIKFQVHSAAQLAHAAQQWKETLQRTACFPHVRRLMLGGQLLDHQATDRDNKSLLARLRAEARFELNQNAHWHGAPTNIFLADERPPTAVYEDDEAWTPLGNLIKLLPALSDLVYACSNQISPYLLQTLHEHQPSCRLHMRTFKLRSLNDSITDTHELALASSPCLHSILVKYDVFDENGAQDYNEAAAMRIVAGRAPNLKEMLMIRHHVGNSPALQEALRRPRRSWIGFTSDNEQSSNPSRGSLHHLHLNDMTIESEVVQKWSTLSPFSFLRTLGLEGDIDTGTFHLLATTCEFPSLKNLSFDLVPANFLHGETSKVDLITAAERYLCSLPSLHSIELVGAVEGSTLSAVLNHHGMTLRRLWLTPSRNLEKALMTQSEILSIREACPLLENLRMVIPRSQGNAAEVAIYDMIGSLAKLQSLSLILDAVNSAVLSSAEDDDEDYETPSDPTFDVFDQALFGDPRYELRPRNGHVRLALINSALDATLARAIFLTIAEAKPRGALPLQSLELRVAGGGGFGATSFSISNVVRHIGRSWLLERNPRDDRRDEVLATELGRQEREEIESWLNMRLDLEVEPIFRRIWPRSSMEGGDWRDDWHSWPLLPT